MEFTDLLNSNSFRQWFGQFLVVFFLVAGLALLTVGVSLVANSSATLRFFAGMNRWVSTRRAFKPVEIPRDTRHVVQKYRMWLAGLFMAGGAYAIYGLTAWFDPGAVIWIYRLDFFKPAFASWVVDSARWVLLLGNLVAIVVGIMLAFFPERLNSLESAGSRWYSERNVAKGRERMNLTLDSWVAESPRASGCIIAFFALVLLGAFGLWLPAVL